MYSNSKEKPEFKIGDVVEYEISWWGTPRWVNNVDRGGSGRWEQGLVTKITELFIDVEGKAMCVRRFPNIGNVRYSKHQWGWHGYLRKIVTLKESEIIISCQCGGDKCNTPHSDWCPKSKL